MNHALLPIEGWRDLFHMDRSMVMRSRLVIRTLTPFAAIRWNVLASTQATRMSLRMHCASDI